VRQTDRRKFKQIYDRQAYTVQSERQTNRRKSKQTDRKTGGHCESKGEAVKKVYLNYTQIYVRRGESVDCRVKYCLNIYIYNTPPPPSLTHSITT
jgi:hypothetical protein